MDKVSVLFVCLGNICRSPTAHGVFLHLLNCNGLDQCIRVDSAGTGDWHVGRPPDRRAAQAALNRGYDLRDLRARQVSTADFAEFDYILAMDRNNLQDIQRLCPVGYRGYLGLLLEYGSKCGQTEVPDPYSGGESGFELVLDLVEDACTGLLRELSTSKASKRNF